MSGEQYSDALLQAMSVIADRTVSNAKYNKTIQATIVECIDSTIGEYKIKYQNGYWTAYSQNVNTTYMPGASVYINIPNGDMSSIKTIVGTTQKLGINYINVIPEQGQYEDNGNNILTNNQGYSLSSYKTENLIIFEEGNDNFYDADAANIYIKSSSHLQFAFDIQTDLNYEQRYNGNYGIKFYLKFKDNTFEETVTRVYTFDIYKMEGNPYSFFNKTNQKAVFEIDGANFIGIEKIELFTQRFPNQDENAKDDIFISNLSIKGMNQLSQEEMDSVSLSFVARRGYIFNDNSDDDDIRPIQAVVRVLGKVVNEVSQNLKFYWFVQNVSITESNPFYLKYGGYGWKCLNNYNVLSSDENGNPSTIEYIPSKPTFSIAKKDVKIKQQKYKCVVLYGDSSFSKEFVIINEDAFYKMIITSDAGTQFIADAGSPTLTCYVMDRNQEEVDSIVYRWGVINNQGIYSYLPEGNINIDENIEYGYPEALEEYNQLKDGIEEHSILQYEKNEKDKDLSNIQRLEWLEDKINTFKQQQTVYQNKIFFVDIKRIDNFSTFICTAMDENSNVLGTQEITLINKKTSNGGYSLVINNGTQVFNYNEEGISPCEDQNIKYVIPELTFTLYNEKGEEVNQNYINVNNIKWFFPNKENSLLTHNYDNTPLDFYNQKTFSYGISKKYFSNKQQNDIKLEVTYNGYTLNAKTNLTFTKEGFLGTNGTGLVLKIVPDGLTGNSPCLKISPSKANQKLIGTFNFDSLKAQLWDGEQQIEKADSYFWQILIPVNKKTETFLKIKTSSTLTTTSSFIKLEVNNSNINKTLTGNPYNIIKLTVTYNGKKIYTTLSICIYKVTVDSQYDIELKENSGFKYVFYAQDGTRPNYNDKTPFIITVKQKIGNIDFEEINTAASEDLQFSYIANGNFKNTSQKGKTQTFAPIPLSYFNGQTLDNYVYCLITKYNDQEGKITIGQVLIPIHMMLNRYGHAALNDWDGNSIDIGNTSHDTILAPQVGAGQKNNKNEFTGILMGSVKVPNQVQNGLFGYSNGNRTIFLDAETGNANFGIAGNGQIQINAEQSTITGGGYLANNKTGMLIDLKKPEIKFGSGNFSVSKEGYLTAKGGGSIAGWNISNTSLSKDTTGMSSDNSKKTNLAFWAGNQFNVNFNGHVNATSIDIGGNVHIRNGQIYGGNYKDTDNNVFINHMSGNSGFLLDTAGMSLGENFKVTSSGYLTAKQGTFGNTTNNFTIGTSSDGTCSSLQGNNVYLGTDKISLGSNFSVDNTGKLTASSGKIASWNFNNGAFYDDNASKNPTYSTYDSKKKKWIVNTKGMYFGNGGIRFGANFHVGSDGNMYAIAGTIGGWTIGASSLTGGSLILYSSGAIKGSNWNIAANGEATFNNVKTANIKGGEISGGKRTGGSITGGSISPSGVGVSGYNNMQDWCNSSADKRIKAIYAELVDADYLKSKISSINILTVKTLSANKVLIGGRRGIQAATQTWVANHVNDKLKNYAKTSQIPTYVIVNGVRYTLH